jgi:MFS family permease
MSLIKKFRGKEMKTYNQKLMTILIISGIMISYIMQMGPSPLLTLLRDEFQLYGKDTLLNLCVSVIFPFLIVGGILGGYVDQRLGTSKLYILTMVLLTAGIIGNFWATNVTLFLIFRAVFGLGFGVGVPFIGSAIMKWYAPKQRDAMTTINGLFPFVATLLSYCLMLPLSRLFNDSWRAALGCWGVIAALIISIWVFAVHRPVQAMKPKDEISKPEKSLYKGLLRRRSIRILTVVFVCDFFCYSYIATILPVWLYETGGVTEVTANILAAIAFPLLGLIGCGFGGVYSRKTGRRKPPLVIGQAMKLAGLILASISTQLWIAVLGISVYAFGNGLWMPSMYGIPTELDRMTSTRVGAAYTLMSAFGFAVGFFSPLIGGYLTERISFSIASESIAAHVCGLRWSVFIFSFLNLVALIFSMRLAEPASKRIKSDG